MLKKFVWEGGKFSNFTRTLRLPQGLEKKFFENYINSRRVRALEGAVQLAPPMLIAPPLVLIAALQP